MKRLKYMSMMGLAALLLTTWSACSDDTDIPGGENPEEARAYTTVTIAVPNGVAETRAGTTADTDDNTTEAGSEDEYKVKTANLYLFPGGASSSFGSAKLKEIISINQFTQMTASTADAKTIVWTSKKTALTPGDYRIYIVVNGTVNGVTDGSKNSLTEADFLAKTTADATGVIAAVPEAGLVMASRSPNNDKTNTLPYIAQTITKDPEQTIAATVERMMGKITVMAGGANVASAANVYTSFSTTVTAIGNITNITLTGYYVVNARKEGYYFRHVDKESTATNPLGEANYGNSTTSLPYVVDPKTYSKTYSGTPAALAGSYADWYLQGSGAFGLLSFGSFGGTYTAMPGYSSAAAETKVAAYCHENTMLKDKQKNGYTTGIVFKAEIAPSKMMQKKAGSGGVEENSTFTSMSEIFYHSGIFYKDIAALKEAGVLLADGTTSSSAGGAPADLKKNDVQCFKKGSADGKFVCYYPYWIKHIPSENTAEDVMEFGIVRNNVYKVTVTGIQGVGKDGVTEDIITDTETDDPTTVLLNVKLSIKPWIVRTNNAVLGR
ncbi:Mfa1 family fimbria major subunit [Bacteroides fragilis]|uniref:Mfa1 family fimbria major subunit n=1 Tax=Bacteroides fragilis TaxID=817 RepID=A0A9Q4P867_BACFG|nr:MULTISPECIES: Mfa1 family fimbria major subunit [Bacteroides]MCE8596515.1 Mfa1 family fimbria major subunit [Bacteroides fragilis]MCE8652002.1 Mfa1 family fimbria major subunit [Bacteroides fragilis]MCY1132610.1 Mfa1 family fimbria major subunit [Bacteroides fragilis]MCZ2612085.1 Mfa1 family fimbria major subunit [Bacteroides fragilis]MCZ2686107.1 Mfa1 family fimbria major subunit [Bacteroides fragilis]